MKARYKPLAHEAKMPEARFSKAPAILNREFQLDIWNKLSGHPGRNFKPKRVCWLYCLTLRLYPIRKQDD